jgi:hypothetical protein
VCTTSVGCTKIIHLNAGTVVLADSSDNTSSCQSLPWTVNPGPYDSVGYAVQLSPGQSITFNFSPGEIPTSVYYKCATSAPSPGPAPTRDQLYNAVFSGGYTMVVPPSGLTATYGIDCPYNWAYIVLNFGP